MSTRRWIKFWPQDWQRDPALRSCGVAARGVWMDMLCIMHEGAPYGYLTINGRAATSRQVGSITGIGERDAAKLIDELETAGVFSRNDDGVIFSRRMVRDHDASEAGREAIKERWSNGGNGSANPSTTPNTPPNRGSVRSDARPDVRSDVRGVDSLEARSKKQEAERKKEPPIPPVAGGVDFDRFWEQYPRKVGRGQAVKAWATATRKAASEAIIQGLHRAVFSPDPRFVPHPATWLNGERWLDQQPSRNDAILRAAGLTPGESDGPERLLLQ